MATELEISEFEDPFEDSSLFCLLPKTLAPHFQFSDSDENLFKSMVAQGSPQLMQQAQAILNSYKDIDGLYTGGVNVVTDCKDRPQERRPALGRKRARFSLKPSVAPSHSVPDINISSSIDHIDDPEEYFQTFEKLENAEKELQKLRGNVPTDVVQQNQGITTRKRRPGLSEKTARYKHHILDNDVIAETLVKIQEKHHDALPSSTNSIVTEAVDDSTVQAEKTNNELQEATDHEDSMAEKENNVNNLLDELISSYKDLDGNEDQTLLRESLQLKSIDVGKIRLPDLPNIQFNQYNASKSMMAHTKLKDSNFLSPSRSPLVSLSTLQKRMSLNDLQKDIYSSFPRDDAPYSPDSSLSKSAGKKSISPLIIDNHGCEDDICLPVVEVDRFVELSKHSLSVSKRNTIPKSIGISNEKGSIFEDFSGCFQEGGNLPHDPLTANQTDASDEILASNMGENSNSGINTDMLQSEVVATIQTDLSDTRTSQENSCPTEATIFTNHHLENQHALPDKDNEEHVLVQPSNEVRKKKAPPRARKKTNYNKRQIHAETSCPPEATSLVHQQLENHQDLHDSNNEEHRVALVPSSNEVRKRKAPPRARNKRNCNSRKSLAGAGMIWEDGRRKSSRHKFRPLEHWRGERLLYGRIHDSLATVIGVKYASPGKNSMKVESCVSDKYAELVAQAARC